MFIKRKGQSTLEYALIIGIVVAGLLLMQHYVKRGLSGSYRERSDDLGSQYDPHKTSANYTYTQFSKVNQSTKDRVSLSVHEADQISNKTGSEDITAWNADESLYER